MQTTESRVAAVVGDIRNLAPDITRLTQRIRTVITKPEIAALQGRERAEVLLPCDIGAEALDRCQILVVNNVVVLETLGVISLTRYVFEILVWLRNIKQSPLQSLRFMMLCIKDGEDHTSQHIAHLEAEAEFLDLIENLEVSKTNFMALKKEHGEDVTTKTALNMMADQIKASDLEVRRHFTLYAAEGKVNGYSYQAHLIRKKVIPAAQADLEAKRQASEDFVDRFGQSLIDEAGVSKLKWFESAKALDMEQEYEFIYRYTSRLLHATPSSFYTDSKNLELNEMRLFLEYVYVRLLDVIEVVTEFAVRAETMNGQGSN
jgi:hypothetical protein